MITVKPINSVWSKIDCETSEARDLADKFTFDAPGAKFHPLVKARVWDGKIRLFNLRERTLYRGLLPYVRQYASENNCQFNDESGFFDQFEYSVKEANAFYKSLRLPDNLESRDYQIKSFVHCIRHRRALFVSPTGSGKSLVIYMLLRYFNTKTLIIIDSLNLLKQMKSDFADYGYDADKYCHQIYAKQDKNSTKPIYIATWQSARKMPKSWFNQFGLVIGDEAHQYDAKSCKTIMESLESCEARFGFTGTLKGTKTNQLVLEGLFGPYKKIVTTSELQELGYLAPLEIKAILLKYSDEVRKQQKGKTYQDEISFLFANESRNKFIKNLALSLKGNTLVLFRRIESHGVPLFELIQKEATVPTYYVSGKVEGDDREHIRKIVNQHESSITVASLGTFAKGVNIPKIHNIIFASPSKAQTTVLQAIGRGLRTSKEKDKCVLFDIADDLSWKSKKNYTLNHFTERTKMYISENFEYKIYQVNIS